MSFERDIRPDHLNAPVYSAAQRQDYLAYIYGSTKAAAKILFPNIFFRPFDKPHDAIFEVIDDDSIPFCVVVGPRGMGKTKITQLALPARRLLMRMTHYFVPIGASLDNEIVHTQNLKFALETSEQVKKLFGPVAGDSWAKTEWTTAPLLNRDGTTADWGSFVRPRGRGQEVRSIAFHEYRPDFLLLDDIQGREDAQNDILCQDTMDWIYADVMGCVDLGRPGWRIFAIGTNLGEKCAVMQLSELKNWTSVQLSLCNSTTFVSDFPNYVSDQGVKDLISRYEEANMFDVFCREYMGLNVPVRGAAFVKESFQHYDETDDDFIKRMPYMYSAVIIDPAKTRSVAAADTAITGFSFDRELQRLYFRNVVAAKLAPEEAYDAAIDMCLAMGARILGVEVTSLHEFITKPLLDRIRTRGAHIELVELSARHYANAVHGKNAPKIARASALIPYYRMKQVWHNRAIAHLIEAPLLAFPRPRLWDVLDTMGYSIELLEKHDVYMMPMGDANSPEDREDPFAMIADLTEEDMAIAHMFEGAPNLHTMTPFVSNGKLNYRARVSI